MDDKTLDEGMSRGMNYVDHTVNPTILKYGAIGSILTVGYSILTVLVSLNFKGQGIQSSLYVFLGFLNIIFYLIIMTLAALSYRRKNHGYMSFSKAYTVTFFTGLIMASAALLASVVMILLGISGDHGGTNIGDNTLGLMPKIIASLIPFFLGCFVGAVLSALISAITKRGKPSSFNVY